jgi:restriction endonuclease S subunit
MLLSEFTTISTGYLFRSKLIHEDNGEYQVVQMKDIDAFNTINFSGLDRVNLKSIKKDNLLLKGDILFRSRGQQNLATLINQSLDNTIAVSQFFIIRIKRDDVIPDYLAWYINQKPAQQYLARKAAGSNTQHINKANLEQLEISIPDIDLQNKIVEIHNLSIREENLLDAIKDKRKKLIVELMLKTINKS